MAVIKSNKSGLRVKGLKEANYEPASYSGYEIYDYFINRDEATPVTTSHPDIDSTIGILPHYTYEKEIYVPSDAYYFPLSADLSGYRSPLDDFDALLDSSTNVPNVAQEYSVYASQTLFTAFGAEPHNAAIDNLLDNDTYEESWTQDSAITYTTLTQNVVKDPAGVSIQNGSYQYSIVYRKTFRVTGTTDKELCFSGYFRLNGDTSDVTDLKLIIATVDTTDDAATSYRFSELAIVDDYFKVSTDWAFAAVTCTVPTGNYDAVIVWSNRTDKTNMELRVAGLQVQNQSYPGSFDPRNLNGNNNGKIFPLYFNFAKNDSFGDLIDNDWSIMYRRYLRYCDEYDVFHNDMVGSINFFFENDTFGIGQYNDTVTAEITEKYVNDWGYNIISKEGETLTFRVIGRGYDHSVSATLDRDNNSFSYSFSDGTTVNLNLGIRLTARDGTDTTDVLEDLLTLDGTYDTDDILTTLSEVYYPDGWRDITWPEADYSGSGSPGTVYAGVYRDLMFVPRVITEEEIDKIKLSILALSKAEGYNDTTATDVSLRTPNIWEGAAIEWHT